ncbi:MAG: hypothetical protein V3G41_10175 [Lachnospiraceae bacterium]
MKKRNRICVALLLVFVMLFVSGCGKSPEGKWQGEADLTGIMDDVTKSAGMKIDVAPLVVKIDLKLENGKYTSNMSPESMATFKEWTKDYMGKLFDGMAASNGTTTAKLAKAMGYSSADEFINSEVESMGIEDMIKETTGSYKISGKEIIFDGKEDYPYIFDGETIVGTFEGSEFGLSSDLTVTFYPVD